MATAALLPMPRAVFYDVNGDPLAGGFVTTYVPNTSTLKTTWQNENESTPNANPITLDAQGSCLLYGEGAYDLAVTDSAGQAVAAYSGYTVSNGQAVSDFYTRAQMLLISVPSNVNAIRTSGYYAAGDGGGALYERLGSAPTYEYFQSADGAYWGYCFENEINVKQWGMKSDLSADCASLMSSVLTYAAGRPVYIPVGQFRFNSGVTYTGIVNLRGAGNGCGPGPAAISNTNCSQLVAYFTSGNLLSITSNYPSILRDFQINVALANRPQTTGSCGIIVSGPVGSTNANSQIVGVGFSNVDIPIKFTRTTQPHVERCYMDGWGLAGIYIDTSATIEGNGGTIAHNFMFGPASVSGSQGPAIYSQVGYIDAHDNLCTGGAGFLNVDATTYPAGGIKCHHNVIEDYRLYGVRIGSSDGNLISMVQIDHNEFSNVAYFTNVIAAILVADYNAGTAYLTDCIIDHNVIRSQMAAGTTYINVGSGTNVVVSHNQCSNVGAAINIGIAVDGTALLAPVLVSGNTFDGSVTAPYSLKNISVLRDTNFAFTFATVPTCGNGSEIYVSDGRLTNSAAFNLTLRNGGTGCIAWRMSGQWLTIMT